VFPSEILGSAPLGPKVKDFAKEKFLLYTKMFKALDSKKRGAMDMLFPLFTYPPEYILIFAEDNIGILSDKEKESFAFRCGNMTPGIPKETRKKVLALLSKGASKELLSTIKYVEERLD
jgi:hypothetical protein